MKWYHTMMMATPVVYMLASVLPGCTTEMCPTEEEKAAAKANGTELVEGEDCLGREQKEFVEKIDGGYGGKPGYVPQYKERPPGSCCSSPEDNDP